MLHRRHFLSAAASTALLPLAAKAADNGLTLDQIVAKHTEARGGAAALDAVRSTRQVVEIKEGGNTLKGIYVATADRRMRIDVYIEPANDRVWSEGLDAAGAWELPGGEKAAKPSEKGEPPLAHGIEFNLYGLHRYAGRGAKLELAPRESIGGIDYYVIAVTLADGFQTWLSIDPANWVIARRRDFRAIHPDADATQKWFETVSWDYRPVRGVMTPFRQAQNDLTTGKTVQTTVVLEADYNTAIDPAALSRDAIPA